ncbi:MAG: glycosyl transferase [Clostridia bacterium]|nr:glycosyl transferase [Clostridia bacterium]
MSSIAYKIRKGLKNPHIVGEYLLERKLARIIPDRLYLSWLYRLKMGTPLNLKNPTTFNEKLQWLKLNDHNPLYPSLVDKYEVRQFVKDTIGEQYLIPLLGVYNTAEEVVFSSLPETFVLKPTHTSGDVILCKERNQLSPELTKQKMNAWLQKRYFWGLREWPYKHIKPRIICESMIQTEDGRSPKDYKIFCFHGVPQFAFVASDRGVDTKFDFFDVDWNRQPVKQHYATSSYDLPKPQQWDEMLRLARNLSKDIPHVRVDFYIDASGSILFGELTFFHFSGLEKFEPGSYDMLLGSWIDLAAL